MINTLINSIKVFLASLLVVSLIGCTSKVELITAVPESEANGVLAALLQAGISAQKNSGKDPGIFSIQVESKDVARALNTLNAIGLPKIPYSGFGNVFKKDSLISSPLEERARYIYSLSQELENTLSQIDGVLSARVHVVLPERGAAGEPSLPSSAAIFLKYQPEFDLDPVAPQIRRLVTNSIPGLVSEKISVVLIPAQTNNSLLSTPVLDTVFGFSVNANSAKALYITLISALILFIILLVGGGYMLWLKRAELLIFLQRFKNKS